MSIAGFAATISVSAPVPNGPLSTQVASPPRAAFSHIEVFEEEVGAFHLSDVSTPSEVLETMHGKQTVPVVKKTGAAMRPCPLCPSLGVMLATLPCRQPSSAARSDSSRSPPASFLFP